jgi:hypothetical protein
MEGGLWMARFYGKVALFGLLLLFCILFGVSLATTGIERIQGPLATDTVDKPKDKQAVTVTTAQSSQLKKEQERSKEKQKKESEKELASTEDRSLNLVGNKLGDLLQIVAHHSIKWFVSIFDAVLGKG